MFFNEFSIKSQEKYFDVDKMQRFDGEKPEQSGNGYRIIVNYVLKLTKF